MSESISIDPMVPDFYLSPDYYEVLAQLRRHAPINCFAPGLWSVASYSLIREISSHPQEYCSRQGALVNDPIRSSGEMETPSILHMDPPDHSAFRRLLNKRFTPRSLDGLSSSIKKMAHEVIHRVASDEPIDFVQEIAAPFPILVISELLGIAQGDRQDFRRWSDAVIEAPDASSEDASLGLVELAGFMSEHIEAKRLQPGDDLVSLLLGSEIDGRPLSNDELFMFLLTLLVAGNETMRTFITGSTLALFEYPQQRQKLLADFSLIPRAVEECLRWVTPIHAFCRTATSKLSIGDQTIDEGDYLVMLYASGNRDESAFGPTADQFDVSRLPDPMHVALGFGEHVCLGASLARLEARIFLTEFLSTYPQYVVTGSAVRVPSTTVAGISSLPVLLNH